MKANINDILFPVTEIPAIGKFPKIKTIHKKTLKIQVINS